MNDYVAPELDAIAFSCPHCNSRSQQRWKSPVELPFNWTQHDISVGQCIVCDELTIWVSDTLVFPDLSNAQPAHTELPDEVKQDYAEARAILSRSPRAAAALLRLAVEKIVTGLEPEGDGLFAKIGNLVDAGLPVTVSQALDTVRVIGNNAVHPGEIDLQDDVRTCSQLFGLVNIIVQDRIAQPKEVAQLFAGLPESQKEAIDRRDG